LSIVGDTVQDLRRFVNKWGATLAGMATTPKDAVLRDILLRQIRPSQLLKYDIEVFDRASEKAYEKSYGFLRQSMKNLIDRERLRENRNRIAEKNKAGGGKDPPKAMVVAIPTERVLQVVEGLKIGAKGTKFAISSRSQCDKGKDDKARTQSPRRNRTRSPSKGNKDDKGKKMSKEEMAKTPCIYHAQGKCRRGDKCFYNHDDKAAAATSTAEEGKGIQCCPLFD
jgi:hypothetical protein